MNAFSKDNRFSHCNVIPLYNETNIYHCMYFSSTNWRGMLVVKRANVHTMEVAYLLLCRLFQYFPINSKLFNTFFKSWRVKPEWQQTFAEASSFSPETKLWLFYLSSPSPILPSTDVSLKLPVTAHVLSSFFKKKHTQGLGIQPGLQIFKLEEITSRKTNICRSGIQVGFLHLKF